MECAICGSKLPDDQPICLHCDSGVAASARDRAPDEVEGHIRAGRTLMVMSLVLGWIFSPFAIWQLVKAERVLKETRREDHTTLTRIRKLKLLTICIIVFWLVLIWLVAARRLRQLS